MEFNLSEQCIASLEVMFHVSSKKSLNVTFRFIAMLEKKKKAQTDIRLMKNESGKVAKKKKNETFKRRTTGVVDY